MKVKHKTGSRSWLRRHVYSITIILVAVLFVVGGLSAYALWVQEYVMRMDAESAAKVEESQEIAREAVAEKARKLQEQEAAAQQAAEQSKTGDSANINAAACNRTGQHADPTQPDVIVNKKHCIQPLAYAPADLVTVRGATLSAKAADAFSQLYAAAAAAGQPFYVTSSYRSYATQVNTYAKWVATSGAEVADTYSARPGYSEHQTGFAFDVAASGCTLDCFGRTTQYQWFQQNAANYGFIQRYYA